MLARFLEIEITGACGYACRHCYGDFPQPDMLAATEVIQLLRDARGLFDCVIISGGEPFLHPDLVEIVEGAAQDFIVFITTSGHGVTREHVRRIGNKAVLVFGLDGIGPTHDAYRGTPGAYARLLHALDLARDLPKEIITTLWTGALAQLVDIMRLASAHNAILHCNHLIPVGRAGENHDIHPDSATLEKLSERLLKLKRQGGSIITDLHKVTPCDRERGINLFCRGRFNVTPRGDVRPCEFHPGVFGNIRKEHFADILGHARKTALIQAREAGFRDCIPDVLPDPFDYHTQICHRIPFSA